MAGESIIPDDDAAHGLPSGGIMSVAFWLCLAIAAGLYGIVALAPRYLAYLHLHRQFHENQLQLVALERQARHLEQVTAALQNDPAFARELARMDFRTGNPDEQNIPVDRALALAIRPAAPDLDVRPPQLPWFAPLLELLAQSRRVTDMLLGLSAGLVIFAFTFLQDRTTATRPEHVRIVKFGRPALPDDSAPCRESA